jgi:hypothetical protein
MEVGSDFRSGEEVHVAANADDHTLGVVGDIGHGEEWPARRW